MTIDPEELNVLAEKLHKPLERYLKWKIIVDRYKRGKDSKIAQLGLQYQDRSVSERDRMAEASPEFISYLSEWHEAEKKMSAAQIEYETIKAKFDALQSVLAYMRDSMRRLGG